MSQATTASLYVGDLHPDTTDNELVQLFQEAGNVTHVRVCRDAHTRRSLGYAYVNFQSAADAERALDILNYTAVRGKPIRIMWSYRDPSLRKSGVGNIFIKNLHKSIDNKLLYDTFSQFGNILSCKVANDEKGNSKGYGFVHFEKQEAAERAIQTVDRKLLNDKMVYVCFHQRKTDRLKSAADIKFNNVYVKNLDDTTDSKKLDETFARFGTIKSAVVMTDETGKSKRFGFVCFSSPEEAKAAVDNMHNTKLGDAVIYVARAQKKEERQQELKAKYDQGVNLFVKNLDDSIDTPQLIQEFSQFGTITSAVVMKDDKTGRSKCFGFVCFSSPEEATRALATMNGKMFASKPIYVGLALRKEQRRSQIDQYPGAPQFRGPYPGGPRVPGVPVMAQPRYGMYYQQPQGMVYPQQRPVRRWPGPQIPGGQPMANYMMQQRPRNMNRNGQAQPGKGGARGARNNVPGVPGGPQMGNRPATFKFTSNARNNRNDNFMAQQPQAVPTESMVIIDTLNSTMLAQATPEQQKQMLGERLLQMVQQIEPNFANQITGMFVDAMDTTEIMNLLETPDTLRGHVAEAMSILNEHLRTADGEQPQANQ